MFTATVFFSLMALCVKLLEDMPVHEVVFFRALVALLISYAMIRRHGLSPWGTQRRLLIMRGLFGTGALIGYFTALHHLTIATATTVMQLAPIFTAIISAVVLGEKIPGLRWLCFGVAFSGVALIKGSSLDADPFYLMVGILAALSGAAAYNVIAKLKDSENSHVIIFYFPLVTVPLVGPYCLTHWVWPTPTQWALLVMVGILVQIAQYFMTRAYQYGQTSAVSLVTYAAVLLALIYDLFLFNKIPGPLALLGMALVVGGVAVSTLAAKRDSRK